MCNNYQNEQTLAEWAEEHERFLSRHLVTPADPSNLTYRTDVYPRYDGLFVRPVDPADPVGALEPAVGRWGLIPFFHKGPAKDWKAATNNCRSEEMASKSSFRDAFKRRRCIIPATSFCEHTGPKGSMTKHRITAADGGPLFLAGLWGSANLPEGPVESYTMVMRGVAADDDMEPFHNRQPICLDAIGAATWLDLNADLAPLLAQPAAGRLAFDPPTPAAT